MNSHRDPGPSPTLLFALAALLLAIAFALWSCEASYGPPLESACDWEQTYSIGFAIYEDEQELRSAWEFLSKAKLLERSYVQGFATLNTRTGKHTLHFLAPRGQRDRERIETIGHELMHPACGAWHP